MKPKKKKMTKKKAKYYSSVLHRYANPNHSLFDADFRKELEKIRPDWFPDIIMRKNKELLLEMARNGEKRPTFKTLLGSVLCNYINPKNSCYDKEFTKKLKKANPNWFIEQSYIANQKKQKLLKMAKNGKDRPNKIHKLGQSLCSYISPSHKSFDAKFRKKLEKSRPDWFITSSDKANQKKEQLLDMAKRGEKRPIATTKLGNVLCNYVNPKNSCYDKEFTKKLKKANPNWFIKSIDKNKELLLEMVKNGEKKPNRKTKLGQTLYRYINPNSSCFDKVFTKKIKRIAPEWLMTSLDKLNEKKRLLLNMAKNGEERPNSRTKLGIVLSSYTNGSHKTSFDKVFTQKIKKLAPSWFKK